MWKKRGFFILSSELFCNVQKNCENKEAVFVDVDGNEKKTKDNINEFLELIFNHIENSAKGSFSENSFAGLFDHFDVNSNKPGATVAKRNEHLAKLLNGVAGMNLGSVKDHDVDAYEYLITMYASNAGKSGGEFFTPADVSELLTRLGTVGKATINKVYDKILPPVSRFGGGGRAKKKQSVIEKLKGFFEKYFGIGGPTKFS